MGAGNGDGSVVRTRGRKMMLEGLTMMGVMAMMMKRGMKMLGE